MGQHGGMGHWWWLWESLGLTSDLGKALACRKDTASSRVSSAATELTVPDTAFNQATLTDKWWEGAAVTAGETEARGGEGRRSQV